LSGQTVAMPLAAHLHWLTALLKEVAATLLRLTSQPAGVASADCAALSPLYWTG